MTKNIAFGVLAGVVMLSAPALGLAATFDRQMDLGTSGSDVSALQTYLASDADLYPSGLVTGYYGQLTKAAVERFQTREGIVHAGTPATTGYGRVGPSTLAVLNLRVNGGMNVLGKAPSIGSVTVSPSNVSATVTWNTDELAKGVVYYSNTPLVTYERTNSVDVSGTPIMTDANFKISQNVLIPNLQPNTTYYYMIYTTNQAGNVSVTAPSSFHTAM